MPEIKIEGPEFGKPDDNHGIPPVKPGNPAKPGDGK